MKKVKYYIYGRTGRDSYNFIESYGYRYTIDGVNFILERVTGYGYRITEETTGLNVERGEHLKTKEQALAYLNPCFVSLIATLLKRKSNMQLAEKLEEFKNELEAKQ